jgi:Ca2+-transporting ATPase
VIGVVALALGTAFRNVGDVAYYQTIIFTSIAFMQVAQAVANRSTKVPLHRLDWRGNPTLLVMAIGVVGLQLFAMYVPFMRRIFDLAPLSVPALGVCIGSAILLLLVIEVVEAAQRRRAGSPARA